MKSRREFLRLVAVGSAAAMTGRASRAAAAAAAKSAMKAPAHVAAPAAVKGQVPRSAAVHAEIEKQKKNTADALKKIRMYPLPAGSPMAFSFRPLRPTGKGGH